jgi:hypothetical protein
VCDYLSNSSSNCHIEENAPGCNSREEVLDSCVLSVKEINDDAQVYIYPNPFNKSVYIDYELKNTETLEIIIYNQLGKQMKVFEQEPTFGKKQVVWNAEGLPAGIYFCVVKTAHTARTMKMIKLK